MYTQSITRSRRTAFFLAIDCSGSMAEPIRFRGRPTTKAEAVASVANGLLFELIERARRSDGVRNYYDIAVLGYSGDDEVSSLLPGDRDTLSVTELAAVRPDIRRETVECRLPDGGIALRELPVQAAPARLEMDKLHAQTPPTAYAETSGGQRLLLWGVLLLGAACMAFMAVQLLRKPKE